MTPVESVLLFLDRINQRNPDKLAELMTDDHVFIDSLANKVQGCDACARAGADISQCVPTIGSRTRIFSRTEMWWRRSARLPEPLAGTNGRSRPPGEPWCATVDSRVARLRRQQAGLRYPREIEVNRALSPAPL